MIDEQYSMVQECADKYSVKEKGNGDAEIYIKIPKRFKDLWIVKLSASPCIAYIVSGYFTLTRDAWPESVNIKTMAVILVVQKKAPQKMRSLLLKKVFLKRISLLFQL
ncbi:MAG: hypothetical protein S4CHLAM7_08020 [Chlamydiae bacterium]|nr:hypothetical protein [Chlamydiota bacterium]